MSKFNKEAESYLHAAFIIEMIQTLPLDIINLFTWVIVENKTNDLFITSDNPVVRYPHFKKEEYSFSGILSFGSEIAYPLTPKFLLLFLEKEYFSNVIRRNKLIFRTKDSDIIKFYNLLQFKDSNKQLYSLNNDFNIIHEIENIYPDLLKSDSSENKITEIKESDVSKTLHSKMQDYFFIEVPKIGKSFGTQINMK